MNKTIDKLENCTPSERTLLVDRLLLICKQESTNMGKVLGKYGKQLVSLLLKYQGTSLSRLLCYISIDSYRSTSVEERLLIQELSVFVTEYLIANYIKNGKDNIEIDILFPLLRNLSDWNVSCCSIMLDIILDYIFSASSVDLLVTLTGSPKQINRLPPSGSLLSSNFTFHSEISLFLDSQSDSKSHKATKYDSLLFKNKKRNAIEKNSNGSFTIKRDDVDIRKRQKNLESGDKFEPENSLFFMDKVVSVSELPYLESQQYLINLIQIITGNIDSSKVNESQLVCVPILTQHFLSRTLDSLNPIPTNEQYQEILPRRSSFPRDEYVWKMFSQSTILFHILNIIAVDPRELCKCIEIIRSLLANFIGYWNIEANSPSTISVTTTNNPLFTHTTSVLKALNTGKWLPSPISFAPELIKYLSPKEICSVLLTLWSFLREFPPLPTQFKYDNTSNTFCNRSFGDHPPDLEVILHPIKQLISNNIEKLSYFYVRFANNSNNNKNV
jgi:hypothetical protein